MNKRPGYIWPDGALSINSTECKVRAKREKYKLENNAYEQMFSSQTLDVRSLIDCLTCIYDKLTSTSNVKHNNLIISVSLTVSSGFVADGVGCEVGWFGLGTVSETEIE